MELGFDKKLAENYPSPSQRARVLTEAWVHAEVFCPNCGHSSIERYANNDPVRDFFCPRCREDFELKAKQGAFNAKIVDGEHKTMLRRLRSNEVPNLFTLTYDLAKNRVKDLIVIPSRFFVPSIIEARKPLVPTARRAGWTGCNILLHKIPHVGRVSLVIGGIPVPKQDVLAAWKRTLFLAEESRAEARGWTLDLMRCIEKLGRPEFTLAEVYHFESALSKLHPGNRHIRAKIRQQLQVLRDAGYLEFSRRGEYRTR